jgi:NAD(P)-dependent dehydrogenase (short-subunit alcohol dehydrogenase family)
MDVTFDFEDEVAVVTGASGSLGSAVVEAFANAGAAVVAVDVAEPDRLPPAAEFHEVDFTDEAAVEDLFATVEREHGRVDALANVAGTWRGGTPIDQTDESTFDLLFAVNLKTMFLATKHALPRLRETAGSVVSVSARSSLSGGTGDGPYRAAKAGVRLLTETVAEENAGTVRANAVMPSVIDTPANREAMPDADHDAWVDPADIADVVCFLCSDAASVTSGAAVPVYGEA